MADFKVGDKVVAPTVFKGVGIIDSMNSKKLSVKCKGRYYDFTLKGCLISGHASPCGEYSETFAELPALHHYKEPDAKMNFLEAMQALKKGFIVQTPSTPKIVFLLDCENDIVFTGTDNILNGAILDSSLCYCTDFIKENVQDTNWSIYSEKEQQVVEWTPKKYGRVLSRKDQTSAWSLQLVSKITSVGDTMGTTSYTTGCTYKFNIPFEGNEHLLGTTDEPKVKYVIKE